MALGVGDPGPRFLGLAPRDVGARPFSQAAAEIGEVILRFCVEISGLRVRV